MNHKTTALASFQLANIQISLGELVEPYLPESVWDKYYRLTRLQHILQQHIEWGDEQLDWRVAHERGWLCKRDYSVFSQELNGLTWEQLMEEGKRKRSRG